MVWVCDENKKLGVAEAISPVQCNRGMELLQKQVLIGAYAKVCGWAVNRVRCGVGEAEMILIYVIGLLVHLIFSCAQQPQQTAILDMSIFHVKT